MKLSWNSLKISIAGAKLSHLVQRDKIWDHGSMIEQVKNIFYKVKKTKANGYVEDLKKYLTSTCFEKLTKEMAQLNKDGKRWIIKNAMIKEIAVIEVSKRKNNKPDCFTALIKTIGIEFTTNKDETKELISYSDRVRIFSEEWSFVSQGEWWLLDRIE
ncbi:MAG: hypothetical protein E6H06_10715 [Bacteroidetes bacterium]|nr:MAG: hypothetical protein E6H06_10715 [Bacteroidota bacterium]